MKEAVGKSVDAMSAVVKDDSTTGYEVVGMYLGVDSAAKSVDIWDWSTSA